MNAHFGFRQHCCGLDVDVHLKDEHQAFLSRQGKASFHTCILSSRERGHGEEELPFVGEGAQQRLWDVKGCACLLNEQLGTLNFPACGGLFGLKIGLSACAQYPWSLVTQCLSCAVW